MFIKKNNFHMYAVGTYACKDITAVSHVSDPHNNYFIHIIHALT